MIPSTLFPFSLLLFTSLLLSLRVAVASPAMTNLVDAAAARDCFAAYTNNVLRLEAVDASEWNPSRRLDRLPFNMPFQLAVGPSAEDRAAAAAALETVATSMPAHIRAYFVRHHLMAPLQQWMVRRFRPGVTNEAQYVAAAAHPVVWQAKDFDMARLSSAAKLLTSNSVPMMAALTPLYEDFALRPIRRAQPIVDYPDPRPEQTYGTPFGVAIVLRAVESRRKFRFVATGYPFRDRNVNFKWVGRGVGVGAMCGQREDYPVERGFADIVVNWACGRRQDVLVFARYGDGPWGPPSVISFYAVPNERRKYGKDGKIESIEYLQTDAVMPQLYQNKAWCDEYQRDSLGNVIGFLRYKRDGSLRGEPFGARGESVVESYPDESPKVAAKVRYFTRPDGALDYEITADRATYKQGETKPIDRGEFPTGKPGRIARPARR